MNEENTNGESMGVEETPVAKYLTDQHQVWETVCFLKRLGGGNLEHNPYRDTIIRLEGAFSGMKMCEFANDM